MARGKSIFGTKGVYWHPESKREEFIPDTYDLMQARHHAYKLKQSGFVYFRSLLELHCYTRLMEYIPKESIEREKKLVLIPKTRTNKEIAWCIDFELIPSLMWQYQGRRIFVEAKGKEMERYKFVKELFLYQTTLPESPVFNAALFVVNQSHEIKNVIDFIEAIS